jgi:hypothetical protein
MQKIEKLKNEIQKKLKKHNHFLSKKKIKGKGKNVLIMY